MQRSGGERSSARPGPTRCQIIPMMIVASAASRKSTGRVGPKGTLTR